MNDSTRAVQIDPVHAERVVSDFAERHGVAVPTTTAEVVALLDRMDYAISPGVVAEFVRKSYIPAPAGEVWDTFSVYALMGALESRRRWKTYTRARMTTRSPAQG